MPEGSSSRIFHSVPYEGSKSKNGFASNHSGPTTPEPVATTETGGLLPNTSSPWGNVLLLGTFLIALGATGFGARKVLNR